MEVSSLKKDASGTIYLTLKIETNSTDSLLQKEDDLAKVLNEAGRLATIEILQTYDKKESVIELPTGRYYLKGVQKKV
jgi:hypothetical protein